MMKTIIFLLVTISLFLGFRTIVHETTLQAVITKNEAALTEMADLAVTLDEILIKTQAGHLISSANALSLAFKLTSLTHSKDKESALAILNYEKKEVLLTLKKMRPPLSAYENFPMDDFDNNIKIIAKSIQEDNEEMIIHSLHELVYGVNKFIQENEVDEKSKEPGFRKKSSPSSSAVTLVASSGA
jgi:hypothetical protein